MTHDFNETLIFVKVVEKGSFTAAAEALGMPKATVSRKVAELERRLGTHLLKRTTRKLGLTEAGAVYYEHSAPMALQLQDAESAVSQLNSSPRGWLRFTAPYSLGCDCISPLLPEFMTRYPEVRVEMLLSNDPLDLVAGEMDLALRIENLPDSSLSARRLARIRMHVYASPAYLSQYGEPMEPEDLEHHRALAFSQDRQNGRYVWSLSDGRRVVEAPVSPVLVANDPPSLLNTVISGLGLALLGDPLGKAAVAQDRLRRVLSAWAGPRVDLNAVFPPGRMHAPKVRAFVDFLSEHLEMDAVALRILCFQSMSGCNNAPRTPAEPPSVSAATRTPEVVPVDTGLRPAATTEACLAPPNAT